MRKNTLDLALELDAVPENGADPDLIAEAAAELRKLHDLLSKANALSRIRQRRITQLETAVGNMHAARMPYAMQAAWAELLVLCGLPQKEQK